MKFSKKFMLLLSVLFIGGVLISDQGIAQNNEAVNADDILSKKVEAKEEEKSGSTSEANSEVNSAIEKGLAEARAENEDKKILAEKVALAKKMHQIRSTRVQVDSAVNRAAQNLPSFERENFIVLMKSMLNYNAIERISIDAMVETYTLVELRSMVEYFSKPEAISASKKVSSWARVVQPEIVRMIDRAMMRIKTGQ